MENTNARKASLLGMPFGTAQSQLKKKLLFHLAGKLGMLQCYRCRDLIKSLDNFSIEHTESWQYAKVPVDIFFDVEKIAFSHLACNIGAAFKPNKIKSVEGMSWCYKCKMYRLDEEFSETMKQRPTGSRWCRNCNSYIKRDFRARTGKR